MYKLLPLFIFFCSVCIAREDIRLRRDQTKSVKPLTLNEKIDKLLKLNDSGKINACLTSMLDTTSYPDLIRDPKYHVERKYYVVKPWDPDKYPKYQHTKCGAKWYLLKDNKLYVQKNQYIYNGAGCTYKDGFFPPTGRSFEDIVEKEITDKNEIRDILGVIIEEAGDSINNLEKNIKSYIERSTPNYLPKTSDKLIQKHLCLCEKLKIFATEIENARNSIVDKKHITFQDSNGDVRKFEESHLVCEDYSS